jgi:hypothetical protein
MRIVKFTLAAALAVGAVGIASAEEATDDSVYFPGPLAPYQYQAPVTAYAPTVSGPYGPFTTVPAAPWVQQQFNFNGALSREEMLIERDNQDLVRGG